MRIIGEQASSRDEAFIPTAGPRHAYLIEAWRERIEQGAARHNAWLGSLTPTQRRAYDDEFFAAMEAAELDEMYG